MFESPRFIGQYLTAEGTPPLSAYEPSYPRIMYADTPAALMTTAPRRELLYSACPFLHVRNFLNVDL